MSYRLMRRVISGEMIGRAKGLGGASETTHEIGSKRGRLRHPIAGCRLGDRSPLWRLRRRQPILRGDVLAGLDVGRLRRAGSIVIGDEGHDHEVGDRSDREGESGKI
jgi:hypothetical protein